VRAAPLGGHRFQAAGELRAGDVDGDQGDDQQRRDGVEGGGSDQLAALGELVDPQDADQRGVLHQGDQLADLGRYGPAKACGSTT
jgi:hypothetical protein